MTKPTIVDLRDLLFKAKEIRALNEGSDLRNKNLAYLKDEIKKKIRVDMKSTNIGEIIKNLEDIITKFKNSSDYWNVNVYKKNAEINITKVRKTVAEFNFHEKKMMICGRGVDKHPDFFPRFSTPTSDIESNLYVTVDHDPDYKHYITRKGNYALCIIVDPAVAEKVLDLGGDIFWFAPDFMDYPLPQISIGKIPRGNSGLAAVSLSSYFGAKFILLSGISLTGSYNQFIEGQTLIFEKLRKEEIKIFSMDGVLAQQLSYDDWCKI
jgi:hypothetical protein